MKRFAAVLALSTALAPAASPCTIVSGKAPDGTTWVGNNEDWPFDFNTALNVYPRDGKLLGAVIFTYGLDTDPQGGVNEKGLFFDFNSLPAAPMSSYLDWDKKKDYPGGSRALIDHMIRTCATVPEALRLFETYRDDSFLTSQLHLADRKGNLAIVNADGVRIAKGGFQVSTNFNTCTKKDSAEGKSCWRYPIADRILREKGVGLESVRSVLSATRWPVMGSTIYSEIVNLSAGDVWLYYAGDFEHPYRFNVSEVLARGRKSTYMRSLFPEAPIVKVWEAYQAKGAEAAIGVLGALRRDGLPPEKAVQITRHVFSACLFTTNAYADARVLFEAWSSLGGSDDKAASYYRALIRMSNGDYDGAKKELAAQIALEPADEPGRTVKSRSEKLLARLDGKTTPRGMRFELKGHANAKFAALKFPSRAAVWSPLLRTPEGWAGEFEVPPGKVYYTFVVDGKTMLDPANPASEIYEDEDGDYTMSVRKAD